MLGGEHVVGERIGGREVVAEGERPRIAAQRVGQRELPRQLEIELVAIGGDEPDAIASHVDDQRLRVRRTAHGGSA